MRYLEDDCGGGCDPGDDVDARGQSPPRGQLLWIICAGLLRQLRLCSGLYELCTLWAEGVGGRLRLLVERQFALLLLVEERLETEALVLLLAGHRAAAERAVERIAVIIRPFASFFHRLEPLLPPSLRDARRSAPPGSSCSL